MERNLEKMCAGSPHGLTVLQVFTRFDVDCTKSYPETKRLQTDGMTDGRTDGFRGVLHNTTVFLNGRMKIWPLARLGFSLIWLGDLVP